MMNNFILYFDRAQGDETFSFFSFLPRYYFPEYGVVGVPSCEESPFHIEEI